MEEEHYRARQSFDLFQQEQMDKNQKTTLSELMDLSLLTQKYKVKIDTN